MFPDPSASEAFMRTVRPSPAGSWSRPTSLRNQSLKVTMTKGQTRPKEQGAASVFLLPD